MAAVRSISVGTDTVTYESMFVNAFDGTELARVEILFVWFTKLIRLFTGNFRVYLFICYGIIACSYIVFIKTYLPERVSYIPFVLVIFPFLVSLNTMRSSLAVAVFLFGLDLIKAKKTRIRIIGYGIIIFSVFFHRMMIAFAILPIFDAIFGKTVIRQNKLSLFVFAAILSAVALLCVSLLRMVVIKRGLLVGTDMSYLSSASITQLFKNNYVTLFPYFALLLFMCIFGKTAVSSSNGRAIKIFCIYDIVIAPAALLLGLWRINEVMYLARLIMWGMLIKEMSCHLKERSRPIFKAAVILIFVGWLVFRIISVNETGGLMPYTLWFD